MTFAEYNHILFSSLNNEYVAFPHFKKVKALSHDDFFTIVHKADRQQANKLLSALKEREISQKSLIGLSRLSDLIKRHLLKDNGLIALKNRLITCKELEDFDDERAYLLLSDQGLKLLEKMPFEECKSYSAHILVHLMELEINTPTQLVEELNDMTDKELRLSSIKSFPYTRSYNDLNQASLSIKKDDETLNNWIKELDLIDVNALPSPVVLSRDASNNNYINITESNTTTSTPAPISPQKTTARNNNVLTPSSLMRGSSDNIIRGNYYCHGFLRRSPSDGNMRNQANFEYPEDSHCFVQIHCSSPALVNG